MIQPLPVHLFGGILHGRDPDTDPLSGTQVDNLTPKLGSADADDHILRPIAHTCEHLLETSVCSQMRRLREKAYGAENVRWYP